MQPLLQLPEQLLSILQQYSPVLQTTMGDVGTHPVFLRKCKMTVNSSFHTFLEIQTQKYLSQYMSYTCKQVNKN